MPEGWHICSFYDLELASECVSMSVVVELFILRGPFSVFCQNKAVADFFVAQLSSPDFSESFLRI